MPIKWNEFLGQEHITNDLRIHIANSIIKNVPLEHTILYGSPGLGKTTLVEAMALEIKRKVWQLTGKELTQKHLYSALDEVGYRDIIFIDEVHRCMASVIEIMYGPLQMINNLKLNDQEDQHFVFEEKTIAPFSFIGATTSPGMLMKPLRDRFILQYQFRPYTEDSLTTILINYGCEKGAANIIAKRSRGVPRIAVNFFMRLRNEFGNKIKPKLCIKRFEDLGVDSEGFGETDLAIMQYLKTHGTVSANEIRKALFLDDTDFHEMYEPFLLQKGVIKISSRGRSLTQKGLDYVRANR